MYAWVPEEALLDDFFHSDASINHNHYIIAILNNHQLLSQFHQRWRSVNNLDQLPGCYWCNHSLGVDESVGSAEKQPPGSAASFRWKSHCGSWRMDVVFSPWTAVAWPGLWCWPVRRHIRTFTNTYSYTSLQPKSSSFFFCERHICANRFGVPQMMDHHVQVRRRLDHQGALSWIVSSPGCQWFVLNIPSSWLTPWVMELYNQWLRVHGTTCAAINPSLMLWITL